MLDTPASVIAGLTYNFLPFMILPIYASLEQIDKRLIEAAKDLYSSARTAFSQGHAAAHRAGDRSPARCSPSSRRVGDYINAEFLGSQNQAMIGNVIQSQYLVRHRLPGRRRRSRSC